MPNHACRALHAAPNPPDGDLHSVTVELQVRPERPKTSTPRTAKRRGEKNWPNALGRNDGMTPSWSGRRPLMAGIGGCRHAASWASGPGLGKRVCGGCKRAPEPLRPSAACYQSGGVVNGKGRL